MHPIIVGLGSSGILETPRKLGRFDGVGQSLQAELDDEDDLDAQVGACEHQPEEVTEVTSDGLVEEIRMIKLHPDSQIDHILI